MAFFYFLKPPKSKKNQNKLCNRQAKPKKIPRAGQKGQKHNLTVM